MALALVHLVLLTLHNFISSSGKHINYVCVPPAPDILHQLAGKLPSATATVASAMLKNSRQHLNK